MKCNCCVLVLTSTELTAFGTPRLVHVFHQLDAEIVILSLTMKMRPHSFQDVGNIYFFYCKFFRVCQDFP